MKKLSFLDSSIERLETISDRLQTSMIAFEGSRQFQTETSNEADDPNGISRNLKERIIAMHASGKSGTRVTRFLTECVFTQDELLNSNMTGSNNKDKLDADKIMAITKLVSSLYPTLSEGNIRAVINQKCVDTRRGK